jgi:NSS family neurotransmitter:Na+ symporter
MNNRETFSSNAGFVLACTGAAIGLGNLWMFPWRLGQYGGAAFLVPYLFFVYVLGTTGLMGEWAFGRWAQKGAIGAYDKLLQQKGLKFGRLLGAYPVITAWAMVFFYAVVTGWIIYYLAASMTGSYIETENVGAYFGQLAGNPKSIFWLGLALMLSLAILIFGVSKGLERANRIFVPVLLGLFLLLVIRSVTLPGAMAGIKYIFIPDWSYLLKPVTWGMALGQAFFTVSLNGCGMVVFGSYLKRDADIPRSAIQTVTLDTGAALLATLMIIPAVFAFGLDPAAGPPLLFITLPEIFRAMPGGQFFGLLFFLSILLAALSSLISMVEPVIEGFMDQFNWGRKKSVIVIIAICFLGGIPLAIDMAVFTRFVDTVTIYIAPGGAVVAAILFFWVFGADKARQQVNQGAVKPVGAWWNPVARYLYVGIGLLIVVLQIAFGIG